MTGCRTCRRDTGASPRAPRGAPASWRHGRGRSASPADCTRGWRRNPPRGAFRWLPRTCDRRRRPALHTCGVSEVEIYPRGPFSLAAARDFAGGFPAGIGGGGVGSGSITLSFWVEGFDESAAIELWQDDDGVVRGRSDATGALLEAAAAQAARSLSLDHDGTGWPEVGERDPVIGRLQRDHDLLRPVCFYSAYEAATPFVIGQRISRRQSAVIKRELSERLGDRPTIGGVETTAFPTPTRLADLEAVPGLADTKVERLRGLARAALDGRLDTEALRSMPEAEALERL